MGGFGPSKGASIPAQWTETMTAAHNASLADTWEDWNISATVGSGVRLVEIGMDHGATVTSCGVRQKGSSDDRRWTSNGPSSRTMLVLTNSSGVIQVYSAVSVGTSFYVIGYSTA